MPGLLLAAIFAAAAGAAWLPRAAEAPAARIVVSKAPAPALAGPVPEAARRAGRDGLHVPALSEVWEAPARPPLRPARHAGAQPRRLQSNSVGPAATPAQEVDRWASRLAGEQRAATRTALERMGTYEPLILAALAERGLPGDLVFVALIESEFVSGATSRAGAAGIWQFMPATARAHGLEVSDWVDERRDPVRATQAAARHLQWLHRQFGSWHLALAAYNAGEGRVGGVLGAAAGTVRGDDLLFWRVRPSLPAETRSYVPKLLAAARVAAEPERHGLAGLQPRPPLRFREVWVPGGVPLAEVAMAVGAPADEVVALNPHLVRRGTPPGRRWPVRVPAEPAP